MNYPMGIKKTKTINHGNRGMSLEGAINQTNEYYLANNIAIIHKKPTPVTITKVDFPSRRDAVIKEAYFKIPSTTDYNGIYKGKYIDFEAKETRLNFFPLANIHQHQIVHLKNIIEHGGIGFLLIMFSKYDTIFLLDGEKLFTFLKEGTRKSIPYSFFEKEGYQIKEKYQPRIDYLDAVEKIYFKGEFK